MINYNGKGCIIPTAEQECPATKQHRVRGKLDAKYHCYLFKGHDGKHRATLNIEGDLEWEE